MSEKVVTLHPVEVGDGFRFEADAILEAAKGHEFTTVLVIAQMPDGDLWVSSSAGAGETLILLKHAERRVVFGE